MDADGSYWLSYYWNWKLSKEWRSEKLALSGTEMFDGYSSLVPRLRGSLEDESLEARLAFDKKTKDNTKSLLGAYLRTEVRSFTLLA